MAKTLTREFTTGCVNAVAELRLKITAQFWQKSQNIADNSSVLAYKVTATALGPNNFIGTSRENAGTVKVWVHGANVRNQVVPLYNGTPSAQCYATFSGEVTVPHNADGTMTCDIGLEIYRGDGNYDNDPWVWAYCNPGDVSYAFNTIPRATTPILSASSVEIGQPVTITLNRASSAFTHTLTAKFGSQTISIGSGLTTSKSWTLPESMANVIPNSSTGSVTITCDTFNGSTKIGTKTVTLTAVIPLSYGPSAPTFTLTDTYTNKPEGVAWLQGMSTPKVTGLSSTAQKGASIKGYQVLTPFGNASTSGTSCTLPIPTNSGSQTITVTVVDSRGFTQSSSQTINVTPYAKPTLHFFMVSRCLADGTDDDEGECVKASYRFDIDRLDGQNSKSFKVQVKNGSTWTDVLTVDNLYTANQSSVVSGTYDKTQSFVFRCVLADTWETVTSAEATVRYSHLVFDFHPDHKSFGVFKKPSGGTDHVGFGGDVAIDGALTVSDVGIDGTLTVGSKAVLDYVVEQGSSGVWTYRKWASGIVEAWALVSVQIQPSQWTTWGNVYTSGLLDSTDLTYPVAYAVDPILVVTLAPGNNGGWLIPSGRSGGTKANTGAFEVCRGNTSTKTDFTAWLNYYVKGQV